jgi:hypothetical protein
MDMAETLNHFARLRTVPDSKPGRPCGHSEVNLSNESLLIAWPLKGHPTFTCFFHWRLSPVGWPDSSASTPESGPTGTSTRTHRPSRRRGTSTVHLQGRTAGWPANSFISLFCAATVAARPTSRCRLGFWKPPVTTSRMSRVR